MKRAICYFSATGNGFDIALHLQRVLKDSDVLYIPNITGSMLEGYREIVIITPVYSFGTPVIVKEFLKTLPSHNSEHPIGYYGIIHYGGFRANSAYCFQQEFLEEGLDCYGIGRIRMPVNFSIIAVSPQLVIRNALRRSVKTIRKIGSCIEAGRRFPVKNRRLFAFFDGIHAKNIHKLAEVSDNYTVTSECIDCGECIALCPVNNVCKSEDSNIAFGKNCIGCLGCYNRCKAKAIIYKGKQRKKRYQNPRVNCNDMK